jgi:hypothetical protein
MDLDELMIRLKTTNLTQMIHDILVKNDVALWVSETNRKQLWDGKNAYDVDLSPTYLEDPYFKSIESATRYMEWKQKITPSSMRRPEVPNLYINGRFYKSIVTFIQEKYIEIVTQSRDGKDIVNKYKEPLGLTPKNIGIMATEKILPSLIPELKRKIFG